jgi:hypothetical protein
MVDGKSYEDKEVPVYDNQFRLRKMKTETLKEMGKDVYFKNISPEQRAGFRKNLKIKYIYTIQNYSVHQSVLGNCFNSGCCRILGIAEKKRKRTSNANKNCFGTFYFRIILFGNGFSSLAGDNGAVKVSLGGWLQVTESLHRRIMSFTNGIILRFQTFSCKNYSFDDGWILPCQLCRKQTFRNFSKYMVQL